MGDRVVALVPLISPLLFRRAMLSAAQLSTCPASVNWLFKVVSVLVRVVEPLASSTQRITWLSMTQISCRVMEALGEKFPFPVPLATPAWAAFRAAGSLVSWKDWSPVGRVVPVAFSMRFTASSANCRRVMEALKLELVRSVSSPRDSALRMLPTAQLLAAVFRELGGCDQGQCLALERFGYFLGRWVYLMDAADDLGKDLKEGSFNPFAARLGLEGKKELTEEERKAADLACNQALNATMAQMLPAFHLIGLEAFGPILENVVEKGLPQVQREILFLHVRDPKVRRELKKM